MASYDFSAPRLHVEPDLSVGSVLILGQDQRNYLCNVLRLKQGSDVLIFNGRDGEWRATLEEAGRRQASLRVVAATRAQPPAAVLDYLFAPLKHARLDYMAQKAVEMGASALRPVLTRRTQASRVNGERLAANAVEAAEQCGILAVPRVHAPASLAAALEALATEQRLVFCDEDAPEEDPLAALRAIGPDAPRAVLVGPEGGFEPAERDLILARPGVVRVSLGPRILRADTAAVAILALVQATSGDWRGDAADASSRSRPIVSPT